MNTIIFSQDKLRQDAIAYTAQPGKTLYKLAKLTGMHWHTLNRFVKGQGLQASSAERLAKALYSSEGVAP